MFKKIFRGMNIISAIIIVITTIIVIGMCYYLFDSKIRDEVKIETTLISESMNLYGNKLSYLQSIKNKTSGKRITLVDKDGSVIFDNSADVTTLKNYNNRPEVENARKTGSGEIKLNSDTIGMDLYCFAVKLNDGNILIVASATESIFGVLYKILIPLIIMIIILYFLSMAISKTLTKKIVEPINNIDIGEEGFDVIYEELIPFIRKISKQNKKISSQMNKLTRQKSRFDIIGDSMKEALIITDKNVKVIFTNKSALEIFNAQDVKNKKLVFLTRDLQIKSLVENALNGEGKSIKRTINDIPYEIFCNPICEGDTVTGAVILMINTSENVKAEQIRKEFTANVSHELKTPLTTILGYAEIIQNGIAKPEDIKSFSCKISKEATRLLVLIEDIIKLSGLDERKTSAEMQNVDLLEIAQMTAESLNKYAGKRDIEISVQGEKTNILGNYTQICEIVYNLCDNAIKYNKQGGTVKIKVANNSISVSDTGIGISETDKERIFERFYRVDKSHSKEVNGTGLGLSIVKHIALLHNAKIDVDSKLGKGTKITVLF